MPITDVAYTAGYSSLRQFNSAVLVGHWPCTDRAAPSRRPRPRRGGRHRAPCSVSGRPLMAPRLLRFFAARAVAGVELCTATTLTRSVALPHGAAVVELEPQPAQLVVRLWLDDVRDLGAAVERCRQLFDADADPQGGRRGPLRRPSAGRAGIAQARVSASQAALTPRRSPCARCLVSRCRWHAPRPWHRGSPSSLARLWPSPRHGRDQALPNRGRHRRSRPRPVSGSPASAPPRCGACAARWPRGEVDLEVGCDSREVAAQLQSIRGIGEWTAAYIAMRGLRDPDAFPAGDLGLRHAFVRAGGDGRALREHARTLAPLARLRRRPTLEPSVSDRIDHGGDPMTLLATTVERRLGAMSLLGSEEVPACCLVQRRSRTSCATASRRPCAASASAAARRRRRRRCGGTSQVTSPPSMRWLSASRAAPSTPGCGRRCARSHRGPPSATPSWPHGPGEPRAMRAAGSACARNAICLFVPCHRIVRSDGGLGGYYYGVATKRAPPRARTGDRTLTGRAGIANCA